MGTLGQGIAQYLLGKYFEWGEASETLKPGAVLGVERNKNLLGIDVPLYNHFGILASEETVVHYTCPGNEVSAENAQILETGLDAFVLNSTKFFELNCEYRKPRKRLVKDFLQRFVKTATAGHFYGVAASDSAIAMIAKLAEYMERQQVFSPQETIDRARSRLGEKGYSLGLNNCEHFAIWCKTGISRSEQIEAFLEAIKVTMVDSFVRR